jgi:hypothetical protein
VASLAVLQLKPWWAPMLVGPNIGWDPRTRKLRRKTRNSRKSGRQGISESLFSPQFVNPFTRALAPPFIGRRRDFFIPRIPSNLRNILSVNSYTNVFYTPWFTGLISYIYKPAISSHFKPGLLRFVFDLAPSWSLNLSFMKITAHCSYWIKTSPDPRTSQIPELRKFLIPGLRKFLIPKLRMFQPSWNRL